MNASKKGESVVSVVVIISIVSIMLLALLGILQYDATLQQDIKQLNDKNILSHNTKAILSKLSFEGIQDDETFYIQKLPTTYRVLTGSENEKYKYLDAWGNSLPIESLSGMYYKRICEMKIQKNGTLTPLCEIVPSTTP